jgi:hypothetical protein
MQFNLRWRLILLTSAAGAALLLAVLFAPLITHEFQLAEARRAAKPAPILATQLQQTDIMVAVLETSAHERIWAPPPPPGAHPRQRSVVLLNSSTAFCRDGSDSHGDVCNSLSLDSAITMVDFDSTIPRKLREELIVANRTSAEIPDPRIPRIKYVSRERVEHALSSPNGWMRYRELFPDSAGIVEFSRSVVSSDGTHALVYLSFQCGWLCGNGSLHYLSRVGNTWRVSASVGLWVS